MAVLLLRFLKPTGRAVEKQNGSDALEVGGANILAEIHFSSTYYDVFIRRDLIVPVDLACGPAGDEVAASGKTARATGACGLRITSA